MLVLICLIKKYYSRKSYSKNKNCLKSCIMLLLLSVVMGRSSLGRSSTRSNGEP